MHDKLPGVPEPQVFSNPTSGQEIRVLSIDGDALVVESLLPPGSPQPPPHYHPTQDERFEVLEGEVGARIGGELSTYAAGETFEVPAGTVHEMSNASPAVARVRWETRPPQRTLEFFQALGRVWQAPEDHALLGELLSFSDEIRFPEAGR
jgi:quercetin dioxygenase-like cupin family protein